MGNGDHAIACVDQFLKFGIEVRKRFDEVGHRLHTRLAPANHRRSIEIRLSFEVDDVGCEKLSHADNAATVEGFVSAADYVHVLLRHSSRSIPQLQESA